jgi:hypothetical protein
MSKGIGERLREARTSRGIELEDAERQIKIRKRFLVAMEEERWEVLPGAAYVRGFLHTYAEFLGLDADAVVDEYRRARRAQEEAEPEPAREPAPVTRAAGPGPAAARGPISAQVPISDRVPRAPWVLVAVGVAAVLVFLLVLGLTGGSDEGDGSDPERAAPERAVPETPAANERRRAAPRVKLELTAEADVWVCLLDDEGEPVIEGVTVPAGESEGPFRARGFEITLGNGQVELITNGEAVDIAAPADPVGYRITPNRARELDEGQRPTCA